MIVFIQLPSQNDGSQQSRFAMMLASTLRGDFSGLHWGFRYDNDHFLRELIEP